MSQFEEFLVGKEAETSGTYLMPNSPSVDQGKTKSPAVIRKEAEELPKTEGQPGEQYVKAPQQAPPKFKVDTAGKEPPTAAVEKKAHRYALPSCSMYELDSYTDVKTASAYYVEHWKLMAPVHRHEYCVNLSKRASELGIDTPEDGEFQKYASEDYASSAHMERALQSRAPFIKEAHQVGVLNDIYLLKGLLTPGDFAEALGEFDKEAGIDHLYDEHILDPYASVFGKVAENETGSIVVGNEYMSDRDLKIFAKTNVDKLRPMFGHEFIDEFRKDPVAIFKSLPLDQKKVVARMVNSSSTDPTTT